MKRSRNETDFQTAVKDAISSCVTFQQTSEEMTAKLLALKNRFNVPQRSWAWAWAWRDACVAMFHYCQGKLVYCVEWEGKPIVCNWNDLPEECRQAFRDNKPLVTGHYWQRDDGTIGRPFFTGTQS